MIEDQVTKGSICIRYFPIKGGGKYDILMYFQCRIVKGSGAIMVLE